MMQTTRIRIRHHIMRDGTRWQMTVQPDGGNAIHTTYTTRGDAMTYLYQYTVGSVDRQFILTTEELRAD